MLPFLSLGMESFAEIASKPLNLKALREIIDQNQSLRLAGDVRQNMSEKREKLELLIANGDQAHYGVNTGFGALCNVVIPDTQLDDLQANLVRSHACGFGETVPTSIVRLCLLLKIITLSKACSAIRPELVDFFLELYNRNWTPKVPSMGSLGASGDLAPLAHLSLPCIGEGILMADGKEYPALDLLQEHRIAIPYLKAKEGLALLNGTQYSLALLIHACWEAEKLFHWANLTGALSCEAFNCNPAFLHPEIHALRNQPGQIYAAAALRNWLEGSDLATRPNKSVQDPYSFRCIPQVHGACWDVIVHCMATAERELNAVTDNPLLLSDGDIVSGGNFHAEYLAFASDHLALAICELANIAERRLYQLVCGSRGLPDFLTPEPGVNSGYMIVQYAAAAAVSMNKQLATPSSIDSIISSKGQEDHVSMAANSGWKNQTILKNAFSVICMEWMTACRAFYFRKDNRCGPALQAIYKAYTRSFPIETKDHIPSLQYESCLQFLNALETASSTTSF